MKFTLLAQSVGDCAPVAAKLEKILAESCKIKLPAVKEKNGKPTMTFSERVKKARFAACHLLPTACHLPHHPLPAAPPTSRRTTACRLPPTLTIPFNPLWLGVG